VYEPSPQVTKLDPKFQEVIRKTLAEQCGTPTSPKLAGSPKLDPAYLKHGAAIYMRNCRQCHGVTGDGAGPAASSMNPRPRDYRPGVFKFTSTTYGSKPLREDLIRTVKRGVAGTSMPSFDLLPPRDLEAVVDYVLALTHRGELETQLAEAAEFDGAVDPNEVPRMVGSIVGRWDAARSQVVYPLSPMPVFTAENVRAGQEAFLTKGCSKCHGEDGRGQTKENIGVDSWGRPTKAADLTSGMLRGGTEAIDIYRHIDAGINGTPMPSFVSALQKEPETMWNLTAFVLHLSNQRRHGAMPEAGLLKPLPGVEATPAPAARASADAGPARSASPQPSPAE
jgi:mono/diheme cytochrome c family protein